MELTGLLLGAGASYDTGMPLVWELDNEFKTFLTPEKLQGLNSHWQSNGNGFPPEVISDLVKVLEREDMHYENILGHMEVNFHRPKGETYHRMYGILAEIVYGLLLEKHTHNIDFIEGHIQFLDGISALARANKPLWVFSLNHDLMIECLCAQSGIPLNCGFTAKEVQLPLRDSDGIIVGELRAQVLPGEMIDRQRLPFFDLGQDGLNLFKFHGSLDVFAFRDGRDLLKFIPSSPTVRGVIGTLHSAIEGLLYMDPTFPGGRIWTINEINYADYAGEMQFLRKTLLAGAFKFHNRFSQVLPKKLLDSFVSSLNYLDSLVCIGYGFGDYHINQAIREWLEFTSTRKLVIVDPNFQNVPEVLRHLVPQIESITLGCTDFLDDMAGITRAPIENVGRRFSRWKRNNRSIAEQEFNEFRQREANAFVDKYMDLIKTLPIKDGDIDLSLLGLNPEDLAQSILDQVALPAPEEMLEKFLIQQETSSP